MRASAVPRRVACFAIMLADRLAPSPLARGLQPACMLTSKYVRGCTAPRAIAAVRMKSADSAQGRSLRVDLAGLKTEAGRRLLRAHKKLDKAAARVASCDEKKAALLAMEDPPLKELERLPNCEELRAELEAERAVVEDLESLVEQLEFIDDEEDPDFERAYALAERHEVADHPPPRPPPGPKKPKGPRPAAEPRLPYRTFLSKDGAEIRVGRTAKENDILSCEPEHRDGDDFWMHAAGCPGSHVVIRAESLPGGELSKDAELDAAVLAANYSKAALTGKVAVTLCRARQVKKPFGAKPGLVQLQGSVRTVTVDWKRERHRLDRLANGNSDRA